MKILIVEDDQIIAQTLQKTLRRWQFDGVIADDFSNIVHLFQEIAPKLILMDVNLPTFNGYYWCQKIREISKVPILFISSRTEIMDMVMAMQMGADDYIQKPIDLTLLVAKIQALLRRSYQFSMDIQQLTYQAITLSLSQGSLSYHDQSLTLTGTELKLLEPLFKEPEKFIKRQTLMENCWLGDDYIDDNTLSVNMSRLRKKLATLGLTQVIETKKNYGYRLVFRTDQ
ncbi:DNA-binding response regulator [Aerococcus christensenii]|uniref:DNA-binding response regulator n=1 Tax=Aerococcus christensenii TaxID=87541 RepID=A0A120I8W7_9LACT|nr:response regulator transcription factor [Aerococcus christensenii]AMB93085.1 PhoB family transcriptional regulator [Aerococcus christensenii]KXB36848.1 putative response regulator protein GraR [Aerococcus christensenii]MDK8233482.1 response regulator transcription factor [Aerococcus christensenii]PKY91386.1 DNA-binding response regulator [Aerococcus christensenii]